MQHTWIRNTRARTPSLFSNCHLIRFLLFNFQFISADHVTHIHTTQQGLRGLQGRTKHPNKHTTRQPPPLLEGGGDLFLLTCFRAFHVVVAVGGANKIGFPRFLLLAPSPQTRSWTLKAVGRFFFLLPCGKVNAAGPPLRTHFENVQ